MPKAAEIALPSLLLRQADNLTEQQFKKLLADRINSVDMEKVKADAVRFIPDSARLEIWSRKYFADLIESVRIDQ